MISFCGSVSGEYLIPDKGGDKRYVKIVKKKRVKIVNDHIRYAPCIPAPKISRTDLGERTSDDHDDLLFLAYATCNVSLICHS